MALSLANINYKMSDNDKVLSNFLQQQDLSNGQDSHQGSK